MLDRSGRDRRWALVVLLAASAACGGDEPPAVVRVVGGPRVQLEGESRSADPPVRFAFASVLSPERSVASLSVFADYLARKLDRPVEIVRRKTYAETNELLHLGKVDAALICTGAYALAREQFGVRAIAVPTVRGGQTSYRALIIAPRGRGVRDLAALRGSVFAFSDPLSNTGYRYVAERLRHDGTEPDAFFERTLFTYSHDNTIAAVRDGIADAGVVDSLVWDALVATHPEIGAELEVVDRSVEFPINPVVVSPATSPELAERLAETLCAMAEDSAAAEVLGALGIEGFTRPDEPRYDAIADSWRALGVLPPAR